jgi:Fe-S-cluster containining protein
MPIGYSGTVGAGRIDFSFKLEFVDRTISASVDLPASPVTPTGLLPVLQGFTNAIVGLAEARAFDAGLAISCRKGCGACCRQLVPVAEGELRHLAEVVAALPGERQRVVRERFLEALRRTDAAGLGQAMRSVERLGLEDHDALLAAYLDLWIPCPFLEDESCSIHAVRPLQCREHLVLTPAENCTRPTPETVQALAMPMRPSQAVCRLGQKGLRWMPLVLALEWTEAHRAGAQHTAPAPDLFREFLDLLRETTHDEARRAPD